MSYTIHSVIGFTEKAFILHTCELTEVSMSHLNKLERIERKRRKQQKQEDWKGNRSPQPYKRTDEELEWEEENESATRTQRG
jgi:hypothetical protein